MANDKRKLTFDIEVLTKDAEAHMGKFAKSMKRAMADVKADADNFNPFKNIIGYLMDLGKWMGSLKKQYGEDVFNKIIGNVDPTVLKGMEDFFGITQDQIGAMDQLKNKFIEFAKVGGPTKENIAEFKNLAKAVRDLYAAMGKQDESGINLRVQKPEVLFMQVETAIKRFDGVFDRIQSKLAKGFTVDGSGNIDTSIDDYKNLATIVNKLQAAFDEGLGIDDEPVTQLIDDLKKLAASEKDLKRIDDIMKDIFDLETISAQDSLKKFAKMFQIQIPKSAQLAIDKVKEFRDAIQSKQSLGVADDKSVFSYDLNMELLINQLKTLHSEGWISDEIFNDIEEAYKKDVVAYKEAFAEKQKIVGRINQLNETAMISNDPDELDAIAQERRELIALAEKDGFIVGKRLQNEQAITKELERRIPIVRAQQNAYKDSPFHKMGTDEALKTLEKSIGKDVLADWYTHQNSEAKKKIEDALNADKALRNAALNIAHENYVKRTGNEISYEDFLTTPMPMFRGKKTIDHFNENDFLSFTPFKEVAQQFGDVILETLIKPIETLGTANLNHENEFFVSRDQIEPRPETQAWLTKLQADTDALIERQANEIVQYLSKSSEDEWRAQMQSRDYEYIEESIAKAKEKLGIEQQIAEEKREQEVIEAQISDSASSSERELAIEKQRTQEKEKQAAIVSQVKATEGAVTVYSGGATPLTSVDWDVSRGSGLRNLGMGMYTTPDIDLAKKYGQEIVQRDVDLSKIFIITEDFVTNIDELYEIMGKVKPINVDWEAIKKDLWSMRDTREKAQEFTKNMLVHGYEGVYTKGYGFQDQNAEQLALYADKYLTNVSTTPYVEIQESAETALKFHQAITAEIERQKAVQATNNTLNAEQQQIQDVTYSFKQLIDLMSKSKMSPKLFFNSLLMGAIQLDDELKNILTSLSIMDSSGSINFQSIKMGGKNKGGIVSDQYTLLARAQEDSYVSSLQPKLLAAKEAGVNIGAILAACRDEATGLVYELQNTVKGKAIFDFKERIVNTDFLEATSEQIQKFIKDLSVLKDLGLWVDWNNSGNILFDKDTGFSFVDLASQATNFTVSAENGIKENLDAFFNRAFKFDTSIDQNNPFVKQVYGFMEQFLNPGTVTSNGQQQIASVDNKAVQVATQQQQQLAAATEQTTVATNAQTAALQQQEAAAQQATDANNELAQAQQKVAETVERADDSASKIDYQTRLKNIQAASDALKKENVSYEELIAAIKAYKDAEDIRFEERRESELNQNARSLGNELRNRLGFGSHVLSIDELYRYTSGKITAEDMAEQLKPFWERANAQRPKDKLSTNFTRYLKQLESVGEFDWKNEADSNIEDVIDGLIDEGKLTSLDECIAKFKELRAETQALKQQQQQQAQDAPSVSEENAEKLRQEAAEARQEVEQANRQNLLLSEELSALRAERDSHNREISEMQAELSRSVSRDEYEAAQNQADASDEARADLQRRLEEERQRRSAALAESESLQRQLAEERAKAQRSAQETTPQSAPGAQTSAQEQQAIEGAIRQTAAAMNEQAGAAQRLATALQAAEQAQKALADVRSKTEIVGDGAQLDISAETHQITELKNEVLGVKSAVEGKNTAFEQEAGIVTRVVSEEKTELKKLEDYLTALQGVIKTLFNNIVIPDNVLGSLNEDLTSIETHVNGIVQSIQSIQAFTSKANVNVDISKDATQFVDFNAILQPIEALLSQIYNVLSKFTGIASDNKNSTTQKKTNNTELGLPDTFNKIASKIPTNVATEGTLADIKNAVVQMSNYLKTSNDGRKTEAVELNKVVANLGTTVRILNDVAAGIAKRQDAQPPNTRAAQARITNRESYDYVKQAALDTLKNRAIDSGITRMEALTDSVVRVTGWLQTAENEWAEFSVKVDEAGKTSELAFSESARAAKRAAAEAKALREAEEDNPLKYTTTDAVYQRALQHMRERSADGDDVTLQMKDSGRYTVSAKSTIGNLTKEVFKTFDEDQKEMSRTTVTLKNAIASDIKDVNKLITTNANKVGNANLLKQYEDAHAALKKMNEDYEFNDNLSDGDIEKWNAQIALVQRLGAEVSNLIQIQQKLEGQTGLATSAKSLQAYSKQADDVFKQLGVDVNTKNARQQVVVEAYNKIIEKVETLKKSHAVLTDSQIADIDALIAALKREADAYLVDTKQTPADKDKKKKQDEFAKKTSTQYDAFDKYKQDAQGVEYVTGALRVELDKLDADFKAIGDESGLIAWQKRFSKLKTEIATAKTIFTDSKLSESSDIRKQIEAQFSGLDFKKNGRKLNGDQKGLVDARKELMHMLDEYEAKIRSEQAATLNEVNNKLASFYSDVDQYRQKMDQDRQTSQQAKANKKQQAKQWAERAAQSKRDASIDDQILRNRHLGVVAKIRGKANARFNELDFNGNDANLSADQKAIIAKREELNQQLAEYELRVRNGQQVESSGIRKTSEELKGLIRLYLEKNRLIDDQGNVLKKPKQSIEAELQLGDLEAYKSSIAKEVRSLGFNLSSDNLTNGQKTIVDLYRQIIAQINEYIEVVQRGEKVEIGSVETTVKSLRTKMNNYREFYNLTANGKPKARKTYGSSTMSTREGQYNTIRSAIDNDSILADSGTLGARFKEYEDAMTRLRALYKSFENITPTGAQEAEFKQVSAACNNLGREVESLIKTYQKLHNDADVVNTMQLDGFVDGVDNRKKALQDYVDTTYGVNAANLKFDSAFRELSFTIKNGDGTITKAKASIDNLGTSIVETAGETQKATTKVQTFFGEVYRKFGGLFTYLVSMTGVEEIFQQIRNGIQYVREIDTALTELKKVTNETDAAYDSFLQKMSQTASVVGSTVSELTTMASEWARLGYSMEEAGMLAESTAILLNVSEFENATEASEALISTMQAFKYTAQDSQHVVDILNDVGNNFAVSSDGLAIALQDSASALMEGGNNLEQAVALIAAANRVVQDPASVGAALRTISLRLRGTSVEVLEEMGEEVDGVAESTSKMQAQLKALTGVDIVDMNGAYKDTYTILKEIGSVWDNLTDMDKAAALELMAGKNRANTLSAILSNMKDLEGAYESALGAEGSALKENAAYLDSIQGRIDIFTNELQTMWSNAINDDFIKFIVNVGTMLVSWVEKINLIRVAFAGLLTYFSVSSKHKIDLASLFGIHDLEKSVSEGFLKGFTIGKEGLTGWVSKMFGNVKNAIANKFGKEPIVDIPEQIFGDSKKVEATFDEFTDFVKNNIEDFVDTDTLFRYNADDGSMRNIVSDIESKTDELSAARKALADVQKMSWDDYHALGYKSPAQEKTSRLDAATQKVKSLEVELANLQAKRDEIVSSAAQGVATSVFTPVQTEVQQYKSMFDVLSEIKGIKLTMGNEQDVAVQLDAISAAAKTGQAELANYMTTLGNSDMALKAYVASVNDGSYSLAGFQKFIAQHNAEVRASGLAAKAAAVGHQLLNAALSIGISYFASFAMSALVKFINREKEVAEEAANIVDSIDKTQKSLREQKTTINDLANEYEQLSTGVNQSGENVSLTTAQYERYNKVCNQIADMFPSLVSGYTDEGTAILSLKGNVEGLTQAYKDNAKAAYDAVIAGQGTVWENFENFFAKDYWTGQTDSDQKKAADLLTKYIAGTYDEQTDGAINAGGNVAALLKEIGLEQQFDWKNLSLEDFDVFLERVVRDNIDEINAKIRSINKKYDAEASPILSVLRAYLHLDDDGYSELSKENQQLMDSIVNSFDTDFLHGFDSIVEVEAYLSNFVEKIKGLSIEDESVINNLRQLQEQASLGDIDYKDYLVKLQEYTNKLSQYFNENEIGLIKIGIGIDEESLNVDKNHIKQIIDPAIQDIDNKINSLSVADLQIAGELEVPDGVLYSWDELIQKIAEVKKLKSSDVISVKSYSALTEEIETYNELLSQTSEMLTDNIEVTQEYKDALVELGISREDLNECFYEGNELVVKDAKALNALVKSVKKSTAQNIKLAKSQAQLDYYELYKEMRQLTGGQKVTNSFTLDYIDSLYAQMSALEKTIAKYSLLEAKLLGASNAYEKLAEAQEIDEATDYGSKAEELVNVLAEAFNTSELGTEAAQVAIQGLVPEEVIDRAKTLDEQMKQIYDYFTDGEISKLFTIEFDDDGGITGVEMTKKNVENYVKQLTKQSFEIDGIKQEGTIFEDTWDEFTLNPAIDSLKDFADACNLTEEVAFAFLTSLEKYDINWLGGDFSTMLDELMGNDLEYKIYDTTQKLADLEYKIAHGTITPDELTAYGELSDQMETLGRKAIDNATKWSQTSNSLANVSEKMADLNEELKEAQSSEDGLSSKGRNVEAINRDILQAQTDVSVLTEMLKDLGGAPTQFTLQIAMDEVHRQMDELKEHSLLGVKVAIEKIDETGIEGLGLTKNSDGTWSGLANFEWYTELDETSKAEVERYLNLVDSEHTIDVLMGEGVTTIEEHLANIADILQKTYELQVKANVDDGEVTSWISWLNNTSLSKTVKVGISKVGDWAGSVGAWFNNALGGLDLFANGTAHAKGTAYSSGSWGVPSTENALVGELGQELVVEPNGKWHTVGDNGAEFTKVKRGSIVFNHKQTEDLLSKGYVTGRGKITGRAFAGGLNNKFAQSNSNIDDDLKQYIHLLNQYDQDVRDAVAESNKYIQSIDDKYKKYGNIDNIDRNIVFWNDEAHDKYSAYIESMAQQAGMDAEKYFEEFLSGCWSTVLGTSGEFGIDNQSLNVAYSQMLNTGTDTKLLTVDEINNYIWDLMEKSMVDGKIDANRMIELDALGLEKEVQGELVTVKNMLAGVEGQIVDGLALTKEDVLAMSGDLADDLDSIYKNFSMHEIQANSLFGKYTSEFGGNSEAFLQLEELSYQYGITLDELINKLASLPEAKTTDYSINGMGSQILDDIKNKIDGIPSQISTTHTTYETTVYTPNEKQYSGWTHTTGGGRYTMANGTAHQGGSWGADKTETALVGELGPEMRVRGNKWELIGQNGAEFADVRRGDIIFNHKQTEDLLSKGCVTGRGKAYAYGTSGTAYRYAQGTGMGSFDTKTSAQEVEKAKKEQREATKALTNASKSFTAAAKDFSTTASSSVNTWDDSYNKVSKDYSGSKSSKGSGGSSGAKDEFNELFDWIEVRIEEINEDIDLKNAKLENTIGSTKQNVIIDDLIGLHRKLYDNLTAGASKYYSYAKTLLAKVPEQYRAAAQDGSIAIEEFNGKVGEETLNAIQDYREWVQKGADATQQAEETLTEISSLAKQAIDNIAADYENKVSLRDNKISQYEAYNALLETDVGYESEKIYQAMIKETNQNLKTLEEQRNKMQAELDKRVQSGEIKKHSQDWYDAVNDIAAVDTAIIELKTDTENWQDAINELHWDQLDDLMSKLEAVSDEADNLIDILSNKDAVDEAANWTKEGITSLGLYAQKMEVAEMQAKKYKDEITYLNKNWKKLGYTEQEYVEKLEELKSAQYDAIQLYHDTKDAIVDLNKERVEAIKTIIQEEIDAYTELIEKKKEELSAEKDLYDFQKGVKEQQKDIADIERKLAAISSDNSASARAERARLQAELAEANAALEDTYYDRSISNQQEALDKELENFQEEKDKEIEGWEEYLENTELVVSDSLAVIQSNTDTVYQTLRDMGAEYSLSITEALTSPWKQGESAIQSYTEKFKLNMSATVEELKELMTEFNAIVVDLEKDGTAAVNTVNNSATKYQAATKKPAASSGGNSSSGSSSNSSSGSGSGETGGSYPYGKASNTSGNIKQGAKGNHVKAIQYALNQLGYGNSGTKSVDGIFGSGTTKAVKSFQKAMGISADGIVGAQTRQKFKAKGYAQGTAGVKEDQWALIDELGEELVLHAQNGKLAFLTKGSAVVPHDIAENIMELGQLDPSMILERNKPQIGLPSEIHNTEINIDNSIAELIHIDNCSTETLPDVKKIVNDALEKHTKQLNNSLKKFVR